MSNEIIFHRGDKLKIIDIIDGDDLDRNRSEERRVGKECPV